MKLIRESGAKIFRPCDGLNRNQKIARAKQGSRFASNKSVVISTGGRNLLILCAFTALGVAQDMLCGRYSEHLNGLNVL